MIENVFGRFVNIIVWTKKLWENAEEYNVLSDFRGIVRDILAHSSYSLVIRSKKLKKNQNISFQHAWEKLTLRSNMTCGSELRPNRFIFKVMVWKATSLVKSSLSLTEKSNAKRTVVKMKRETLLKGSNHSPRSYFGDGDNVKCHDILCFCLLTGFSFSVDMRFPLSFSLSPHLFLPLISPKTLSFLSSFFPPSFHFLPPLLFLPPSVSPSFGHFS